MYAQMKIHSHTHCLYEGGGWGGEDAGGGGRVLKYAWRDGGGGDGLWERETIGQGLDKYR